MVHLIDSRTPLHDLEEALENTGSTYETVQADVTALKEANAALAEIIRERVLTLFDEDDEEADDLYEIVDDLKQALDMVSEEHEVLADDLRDLDVDAKVRHHLTRLITGG